VSKRPQAGLDSGQWVNERYRDISTATALGLGNYGEGDLALRDLTHSLRWPAGGWSKELAATRMQFGYQRLMAMLLREGVPANYKRVYRLYREATL